MAGFGDDFEKIVKGAFAPIYPVIAKQIVDKCKITKGNCIDVGCGSGPLSIMLAKITDLDIYALDISTKAIGLLKDKIETEDLSKRIKPMLNDAESMPFDDGFADLIVSRGSMFFWNDQAKAFKEIYRVLKPNGMAYIGCGFGTVELFEEVKKKMEEIDPQWDENRKKRLENDDASKIERIIKDEKIPIHEIIDEDSEYWIILKK
ncbi:MAG TPA: methyltransferase domain-containing protein [Methanofastidiosum sp.]|nr:methyltransferase domain-containing protein [Methanofastidiosum sp.]HNU61357.1 methyltransferase domain-containing protein [Methanofastidiosum sp.]